MKSFYWQIPTVQSKCNWYMILMYFSLFSHHSCSLYIFVFLSHLKNLMWGISLILHNNKKEPLKKYNQITYLKFVELKTSQTHQSESGTVSVFLLDFPVAWWIHSVLRGIKTQSQSLADTNWSLLSPAAECKAASMATWLKSGHIFDHTCNCIPDKRSDWCCVGC